MNKSSVNAVIDTFGGVSELCRKATESGWPLKAGSVYKWRNVGRIPELWGTRLIITAEKFEQSLDRDVLLSSMGSLPDDENGAAA